MFDYDGEVVVSGHRLTRCCPRLWRQVIKMKRTIPRWLYPLPMLLLLAGLWACLVAPLTVSYSTRSVKAACIALFCHQFIASML